jgi:ribose transport system permease protein
VTALTQAASGDVRRLTRWRRLAALQARYPLLQIIALVVVYVYGAISLPGLAGWSSIKLMLVLAALAGIAAAGQTLLILMGGFDLSVAAVIVASALIITTLKQKWDLPFAAAFAIAVVACALLGGLAGNLCHRYEIQPLIVTLAMGTILLGIVQVSLGGNLTGSAPDWLSTLTSSATATFGLGVPPLVVVWALVAVVYAVFVHRTPVGRRVLATGANPRAAENSLIRTRRYWTLGFAFSGIVSALVGMLVAGFSGTVDVQAGDPYLFQSVVTVIVGGTVFGGPGDYTRTVIGTLFLTVLTTVLVGHGADQADQDILYGAILIFTVSFYYRTRRIRDQV